MIESPTQKNLIFSFKFKIYFKTNIGKLIATGDQSAVYNLLWYERVLKEDPNEESIIMKSDLLIERNDPIQEMIFDNVLEADSVDPPINQSYTVTGS